MLTRAHGVAASAALAAALLVATPAPAADAPVKNAHHFALKGWASAPPPGGGETINLVLSGDQTEGFISVQDELWSPTFNVPLHYHNRHAEAFYVVSGQV
ncbi:MAG: hypothetical protein IT480_02940, partial [Gammaproteobacteria bacterium]|nr:hypothetical protein [Gammaproteobacteria bacterium]